MSFLDAEAGCNGLWSICIADVSSVVHLYVCQSVSSACLYVCMHACMHACMYVRMYIFAYVHIYIYACMHV